MGSRGRDLATWVNYYLDPGDGSAPIPVYVGRTSVTNTRPSVARPVVITDISPSPSQFILDTHGFALHMHSSSVSPETFENDALIREEYYRECEDVVKSAAGASRVIAFDHKVRRGPAHWHRLGEGNSAARGPLRNAHVDQSYAGAEMRLREVVLGEEGEGLRKRRWGIVNLWRPLKPVYKDPLAVADARSVADTDLVAASIIYAKSGRRNESWTVKPNPAHTWYYKYAQTPGEVLLIKCFDSNKAVARRAPHCAVEDPDHAESECRESVEVRCLVCY